jgi:LacI family transcriptional regulator
MRTRRAVALLVETSNAYSRGVLKGILRYARQIDSWSLYLPEQERGAPPPAWLNRWQGDGFLARVETPQIAEIIQRTKLPVVDLSAARLIQDIPWVETDDQAIAQLAFDHLRERGYREFAFCGVSPFNWSKLRREAFEQLCKQQGLTCHSYEARSTHDPKYSWDEDRQMLANWIKQLPQPAGIFACYDYQAQKILDVCRELDIAVPEQFAVVGVDNDELICTASTPSLSSVILDPEKTGYEAAQMLDDLMSGKEVSSTGMLIPPIGLTTRQSTDLFAIDDPDIAKALRLIRERACLGAKVYDILEEIPVSRRILESRFKKITGKTPHDFLLRYRLERARTLLRETNLSMSEVAERAGFGHAEYMSEVFIREVRIRPGEYRRQSRNEDNVT